MKQMISAAALLLAAGCASQTPEIGSRSDLRTPAALAVVQPAAATTVPSLNAFRASHGLGTLSRSPQLQAVAEAHARDMNRMNTMSHTGSDGSSLVDRVKRVGYRYRTAAENIAETRNGMDNAMLLWINSPGHRSNMLKSNVTEYGLASSGNYYAMVLGAPR